MRVTFVAPTLAVGGAESFLAALVLQLREHCVEPSVVALNHRGRFYDVLARRGVPTSFAAMSSRYDVRGAVRVQRAIRHTHPEAIVTGGIDGHMLGRWAARWAGVPHVAVEHAGAALGLAAHRRFLLRLVAPGFDLVVAVTDDQHEALVRLGYPASRIRTISNGIPEPLPTRTRDEMRSVLGIPDHALLALLVAVLRPEKQATRFVDAVVEARGHGCPVVGVVAGSGPELKMVERRAEGHQGLTVLGERDDVPDLMAAADVICLTSRAEALPMVVLEAMALGRPVLSTAVGGIPEAIGDSGILVKDSSEAIAAELCSAAVDPGRLLELGARARRRYVERFSISRAAESYVEALQAVTTERRGR